MAPSMNFASQKEYGRVLNHRWILSDGWHRWGAKLRTRRKAREMKELQPCEGGKSTAEIRPIRICANCRTSKTPLWRSGPTGPKSLCNACGIKFRKRQIQYEAGENKLTFTSSSDPENFLTMEELKQLQKEKQQNMLRMLAKHRTEEREKMRRAVLERSGRELAEAALLLLSFSKGNLVLS